MAEKLVKVNRRNFLCVSAAAGAGLVIGLRLPAAKADKVSSPEPWAPNVWLSVNDEGMVTVTVAKSEMGQGVRTSLPMIVAEELEADWSKVRIQPAIADDKYGSMTTGGSTSIRRSFEPLRKAGAAARVMLVAAAAKTWKVEASECRAQEGTVVHPASGRRLSYGELAAKAAKQSVPQDPPLKDPKDFRIIGTPVARLDTPEKVDGRAKYGLDVTLPGMVVASVERCPVFGGKVKSVDGEAAKKVPGVKSVIELGSRVAVLGESTWAAMKGREALKVVWDEGPSARVDSDSLWAMLEEKAKGKGESARATGDFAAALGSAAKTIEAAYRAPFLAHATMEPMNATVHAQKDRCEMWLPTQAPQWAQGVVAGELGLPKEKVIVHTTLLGGGFGRRAMPDFAAEAAAVSRAAGLPVKVVWTREDDMRHDFYRPLSLHIMRGGVNEKGELTAFAHRLVAPSISEQMQPGSVKGVDESAVDGAANVPYAIPNALVEYVMANSHVPVGWWRSVYASQNAFATECFIDELAQAANKDPLEFRLALLKDAPRMKGVLELAAAKAGWDKAPAQGRGRGIACCESFGSCSAHVAEVSVVKGRVKVHRVTVAVDCGPVVNPDTIAAQMESCVAFGLSGALFGHITIDKGRVVQGNFDDYAVPRLSDMPEVSAHIVKSKFPLGGIGEPGLPPLAPAVVNALSRHLGRRFRRLPIAKADLVS